MPIIRRRLDVNTVYPADIRYNEDTDTVQSNVNGDWVDNPEADPRTKTSFPPRLTADPACDAAQSVTDALHGQIDQILEAIDNASTLFAIAGIILSIFTFGVYAIFVSLGIGIADQMVGFGSTAIEAALTEPVYETFRCILFCHMNSSGRLRPGQLSAVMTDITDQIGGIGATILNAMLALAGEGGINNLASLGTSTGDCSECGCGCDENGTGNNGGDVGTVIYLGDNTYQLISASRSVGGHNFQECGFALGAFSPCFQIKSADFGSYTLRTNTPYQILCNGTDIGDAGINTTRSLLTCAFATAADDVTPFIITISICPNP